MQSESREKPEHSDTYRASTSEPGLRCTANDGGGVSSITAAGTDGVAGEQLLWMEMCFDDGDVLHLQPCCHCYALASNAVFSWLLHCSSKLLHRIP